MSTQSVGQVAEQLAAKHLEKYGCKVQQQNFCCKVGEIDLIVNDGEDLVFVEVRYRGKENFGSGAATVSYAKQRKIIKAAQYYLQVNHVYSLAPCRFDVISITLDNNGTQLDWIKNAFQM